MPPPRRRSSSEDREMRRFGGATDGIDFFPWLKRGLEPGRNRGENCCCCCCCCCCFLCFPAPAPPPPPPSEAEVADSWIGWIGPTVTISLEPPPLVPRRLRVLVACDASLGDSSLFLIHIFFLLFVPFCSIQKHLTSPFELVSASSNPSYKSSKTYSLGSNVSLQCVKMMFPS